MKKLVVKSENQTAELWDGSRFLKSFAISTATNGLGCENGSFCTPAGKLRVAEKIGEGFPLGSVFKSRVPTGEIWNLSDSLSSAGEDLVLTRILWLEGAEDRNKNTLERYVYLHGTNHEDKLGTPASHGCIRLSNADIVEVFKHLAVGDEVVVV